MLGDLGVLPIMIGAATIVGSGVVLVLGLAGRRTREQPNTEPRGRTVSIETELQRDVKGKWKRHKQPFLYKS